MKARRTTRRPARARRRARKPFFTGKGGERGEATPFFQAAFPVQSKPEDGQVQRVGLTGPEDEVRRKGGAEVPAVGNATARRIDAASGKGQPLPKGLRNQMEQGLGADFSDVRIHTDARAIGLNRRLRAQAFTYGSDVFFNGGRYRPHTQDGAHLLAHELAHTLQQGAVRRRPEIQRRTGDGHDLTSATLATDPILEAIFDGNGRVRAGDAGPAVERIQRALLRVGVALPQFGADGQFGNETRAAVRHFQSRAGLTVDGVVGPDTLGTLDRDSRAGGMSVESATPARDDRVDKYHGSADEPLLFFFTQGSAELDTAERGKIADIIAAHGTTGFTLRGFASDEGPDAVNQQLARERMDAVARAFSEAGYDQPIVLDPAAWEVGQNNVNFARMRSVKVVPAGQGHLDFDISCPEDAAEVEPCANNPRLEAAYQAAITQAVTWIDEARGLFPLTEAEDVADFDTLFATRGEPERRPSVMAEVHARLGQMSAYLETVRAEDQHFCGTNCDPICQAGAPAYESPGSDATEEVPLPAGVLTVCNGLLSYGASKRGIILVHEGHHGTPGFDSRDEAYGTSRLITLLDTDRALSNAASFELLVALLADIGTSRVGPEQSDTSEDFDTDQMAKIHEALAWPEQWLRRSDHVLSSVYRRMVELRNGTRSHAPGTLNDFLHFLATHFGTTRPNGRPTEQDLITIAALYDRSQRMESAMGQGLELHAAANETSFWAPGPGRDLILAAHFFDLTLHQRIAVILQELIHATPDISADREPAYALLFNEIRQKIGIGP